MQRPLKYNTKNYLHFLLIIIVSFLFFHLFDHISYGTLTLWNNKIYDRIFQLRIKNKHKIDPKIVHVDLNDTSLKKLDISPLNRDIYADVVDILKKAGVRYVVFDMIFIDTNNNNSDMKLINAIRDADNVILPVIPEIQSGTLYEESSKNSNLSLINPETVSNGYPLTASSIITSSEMLNKSAKSWGHILMSPDEDGVYRKIPLVVKYKNGYIPSLALKVAVDYLSVDDKNIDMQFGKYILLKNAKMANGNIENIRIPIDNNGKTTINYFGLWDNTFTHYSFETILSAKDDSVRLEQLSEEMRDFIVIISDITTRGKDFGTVPVESVYPLSGIHSTVLNSILKQDFITEEKRYQTVITYLFLVFFLFICAVNLNALSFALCSLGIETLFILYSIIIFIYAGRSNNLLFPVLSVNISILILLIYKYIINEKNTIAEITLLNRSIEKFVPKEFLDSLGKDNLTNIKLGDQIEKEMTVLFSDIRSFTTLSEKMTPEENFNFINSYLKMMGPIVRENNGFIDKYIGDAIMALFENKSCDAIDTAIMMISKLEEFNSRVYEKYFNIEIGIGIHTGHLMLGIIGEEKRYNGTVISDDVNLASRLEGLTKYYGAKIIVSELSLMKSEDLSKYKYRMIDMVKVKGKNNPITIFEIFTNLNDKIDNLKYKTKDDYEFAFSKFITRNFKDALEILCKVIEMNPEDKAASLLKQRCENGIKEGVSPDWDGANEILRK